MPDKDGNITAYERGALRAKRATSDDPEYVKTIDKLLGDTDPTAKPTAKQYEILAADAPSTKSTYPIQETNQ